MTTSHLRAGAAAVDITPPLGTHLSGSGMGEHRPAKSVMDPLYAKAIVFEQPFGDAGTAGADQPRRLVILALDLILITGAYSARVREGVARRLGIPPQAVMVHCTQTHSAPSFGHCMLDDDFPLDLPPDQEYVRGAETPYCEWAAERAVEAVGQALARLRPVEIGFGRDDRPELAFNRRGEQTIDPEVAVVAVRDAQTRAMVALLLHYSCHPVNVFCRGWADKESWHAVTADWCGAWAAAMAEAGGAGAGDGAGQAAVPIVINGSCGNINPGPYTDAWDRDHVHQGRELAATARAIVDGITYSAEPAVLDYRLRVLELDYREVPAQRLAEVEAILTAHAQPKWVGPGQIDNAWFRAASTRSIEHCRRRHPRFPYEVQAFRIGDIAVVGLPGEPFSEGQLDLKRRSPAKQTLVAHMVSHYVGYLPAAGVYDNPNHETNPDCTYWAKLAKGSLERIVDEAVAMVGEMF